MPAYNDTPLATQQINQTQAPLRTNFQSIQQLVDINHVDFSDPVNFGKHNVSDYYPQVNTPLGSVPAFITALPNGEINVYNTIPNGTAVLNSTQNPGYPVTLTTNELIIQKGLNPSNSFIPITASITGTSGGNQFGWSYLPSGILIKWGQINGNFTNGTWQQFFYPTAANIPVFNNVFVVQLQAVSLDTPPGAQTQTFNYLTVASNFAATNFWWIPRTNFGNVNQRSLFYYAIGN